MLDRQLAAGGETVIIRRGLTDVPVLAAVRALNATEIRSGANGAQINHRAVVSPTGLQTLLPLRATDKLVRGGQERVITAPMPKSIGSTVVRIVIDFAG